MSKQSFFLQTSFTIFFYLIPPNPVLLYTKKEIMKRARSTMNLQKEMANWSDKELNLFHRLPRDLVKLILSEYDYKVEDIENACRAFGTTKCKEFQIFRFRFYRLFGKAAWDAAHAKYAFINDAWFLRAYELAFFLFSVRGTVNSMPVVQLFKFEKNFESTPDEEEEPLVITDATFLVEIRGPHIARFVSDAEQEEEEELDSAEETDERRVFVDLLFTSVDKVIEVPDDYKKTSPYMLFQAVFKKDESLNLGVNTSYEFGELRCDLEPRFPDNEPDALKYAVCKYLYEVMFKQQYAVKKVQLVEFNRDSADADRIPRLEACAHCQTNRAVAHCGGKCFSAVYCGQKCADEHYTAHKSQCQKSSQ
jgi:hypothetical protein